MLRLSYIEKDHLKIIIMDAEINHLNEQESLEYIKKRFSKSISRKTYYDYKHKVYENIRYNPKNKSKWILDLPRFALIEQRLKIEKDNYYGDIINSSKHWNSLNYIPNYCHKLWTKVEYQIQDATNLLHKLENDEKRTKDNFSNVPSNATIRKEYVKCGKLSCEIKHGPYYYAYWKDSNKKLKKKYLGKYNPVRA
jgi:hypothetical protein